MGRANPRAAISDKCHSRQPRRLKIRLGETSLQTVLRTLGNKAQDDIKAEIVSLSTPPNSPLTIELKGSQNPLIDSGLMKDSVRWKIDE